MLTLIIFPRKLLISFIFLSLTYEHLLLIPCEKILQQVEFFLPKFAMFYSSKIFEIGFLIKLVKNIKKSLWHRHKIATSLGPEWTQNFLSTKNIKFLKKTRHVYKLFIILLQVNPSWIRVMRIHLFWKENWSKKP